MGLLDDVRVLAGLRPAGAPARELDGTVAARPRGPALGPENRALPAIANTGVLLGSPSYALGSPNPAGSARFQGGRLSWDSQLQMMGNASIILPPETADESWRMINLDKKSIIGMSATRLLQVLADMSPEVSRALWDFLRLCNPGHEFKAFYPNTDRPHVQGQKALDEFYRNLADRYGSVDVIHGRLFFSAFIRGAMMAELVLDERGRVPLDFATPDPWTARFQRVEDPVLGQVWQLGQYQAAKFVLLDRPTIRYIPIDPAPGNPYGRPPAAPGIFSAIFLLGLLADLRRVIAQQGYPRLDISIDLKMLYETTPPAVRNDPTQWAAIVLRAYNEVVTAYQGLEPDSAFIHTTTSTVNGAKAAVSADAVGPIDGVIGALTEQLARGLKSMPIMFGITEGMSEANANRQWEIHAAGVKAIQHVGEALWGNLGTMALEAQGIPAQCFPADTMVLADVGPVPIQQVEVGTRVLTHKGRWMRVTATGARQAQTIVVRGSGHFGLETTAEHPFYSRLRDVSQGRRTYRTLVCALCGNAFETRDFRQRVRFCSPKCRWAARRHPERALPASPVDAPPKRWVTDWSEPEWREAQSMAGAWWATPTTVDALPVPEIRPGGHWPSEHARRTIDPTGADLWWLVGRWLGDGIVRIEPKNGQWQIMIVCGLHEDKELGEQLRALRLPLRWSHRTGRRSAVYTASHRGLVEWLVTQFGRLSYGKTIPGWALGMPPDRRRTLLDGYLSADGLHSPDSVGQAARSVSKRLAIGVRLLAESLGHRVALSYVPPRLDQVIVEGPPSTFRAAYVIQWTKTPDRPFAWEIDGHAWSRVRSVDPGVANNRVYNLEVEGDNSYVADGITVHNCKLEYAELRAAEMFRDAQTEAQIIQNESDKYWMGWTSQDEASENATGHPSEEPEPREQPTTETVYVGPGAAVPAAPVDAVPGKPAKGPKGGGGAPDSSDVADSKDDTAEKGAASRGVVVRRLRWPTLRRVARSTTIKAKGEALAPVSGAVGFDAGDEHRISTEFDDAVPSLAGLLDARIDGYGPGRRNGHTVRV